MIYLGYLIQASTIGAVLWALSPAPRPVEAFTVDRGQLVIA